MEMKSFSNQDLLKMAYPIQRDILCVCQYKPRFPAQVKLGTEVTLVENSCDLPFPNREPGDCKENIMENSLYYFHSSLILKEVHYISGRRIRLSQSVCPLCLAFP